MEPTTTAQPPRSSSGSPPARALTVAILAMGGEGGGVLADWLIDLAEDAGYFAQGTSVPGVAQRTGSTIYYIELFPQSEREPVLAMMPVPGEVDVLVASELMEAGRAVQRGLVTPDRTTLIASSHRVFSMTEKTAAADGRIDSSGLVEAGRVAAKRFVHADFAQVADETKSVISSVLFGALAGSAALPFVRAQFEAAIKRAGVGVESSLAGFAAGYEAVVNPKPEVTAAALEIKTPVTIGPRLQALAGRIRKDFPPATHDVLLAAIAKLADYQDERYAAEYLDLLQPIRDLDAKHGDGSSNLLRETARYLALWMSYEDASRVADLKIRRARFQRVRDEARAEANQVVRISEYLHPGVDEIADTLPAALGRWLVNSSWARRLIERFSRKGQIVETTSLGGFLLLYCVAAQRRWRRSSYRYQLERDRIAHWLTQLDTLAPKDYALAAEVAECPQLVKGYGETHRHGWQSFEAVLSTLPKLLGKPDSAARLRQLREAALADDTGERLAEEIRRLQL